MRYRVYVRPRYEEWYIGVWEIGAGGRNRVLSAGDVDMCGEFGYRILAQLRVLQGPEEASRLAAASNIFIKFIPVEEKAQPAPDFRR